MKNKILLFFVALTAVEQVNAQASLDDKLFESLHGHASFNVVFVVLGIILLGVLFSIWRLDRKVGKLEKEFKNK